MDLLPDPLPLVLQLTHLDALAVEDLAAAVVDLDDVVALRAALVAIARLACAMSDRLEPHVHIDVHVDGPIDV